MNSLSGQSFSAVEIEINHSCNRKCSYCPNSVLKRKNTGEMEPELFTRLLSELAELRFSGRISYSFYNEPLTHPRLEACVQETRHLLPAVSIEIYTNGTLLTHERFRRLLEAGVSKFIVTRHETEGAEYVFEEVYRELSGKEREHVLYRSFRDLKLTNRGGLLRHLGDALPLAPCFIPALVVTVTVTGNVLPCFEDYEEVMVMGNLQETRLMDIWNSDPYLKFRADLRAGKRHLYGPCRGCNRREVLPPTGSG